jgi:hypothetical protein
MGILKKEIKEKTFVTQHIKLGIKSHFGCVELYTPTYSLHPIPMLHFGTNLIFVWLERKHFLNTVTHTVEIKARYNSIHIAICYPLFATC